MSHSPTGHEVRIHFYRVNPAYIYVDCCPCCGAARPLTHMAEYRRMDVLHPLGYRAALLVDVVCTDCAVALISDPEREGELIRKLLPEGSADHAA